MSRKSRKRAMLEALKSLVKPRVTNIRKAENCAYLIRLLGRELVYRDPEFLMNELRPAVEITLRALAKRNDPQDIYLRASLMTLHTLAESHAIETEYALELKIPE